MDLVFERLPLGSEGSKCIVGDYRKKKKQYGFAAYE